MVQNKKGQVTLFILLAIVIVGIILAYSLWIQPTFIATRGDQLKIDSCVSEVLDNQIEDLARNAGLIEPEFTYLYGGEYIPYLCYSGEYYKTCTVQNPFPEKAFESNLYLLTNQEIESCYADSINDLKRKGYSVSNEIPDYSMELQPEKIVFTFAEGITIEKESVQSLEDLKVEYPSKIYEQLLISTTILQHETQFGDSDVSYMMQLYPNFVIDKIKRDEGTTIYVITDKETQIKYQFALRSLAWPPGYGLTK